MSYNTDTVEKFRVSVMAIHLSNFLDIARAINRHDISSGEDPTYNPVTLFHLSQAAISIVGSLTPYDPFGGTRNRSVFN